MSADRRRAPWPAEILGGTVGSVVMLAVVVTIGLLGYAPLGEGGAPRGLAAAFVSVTVGGLLFALAGRGALPVAGPSSATALIFAGLIAPLVHDPAVAAAGASGVMLVLAAGGSAVVLMGLLQLVFSRLGLGRLAQFVPQPVLAGFMNGVAVLIFVSQMPTLLGLHPGSGLSDFHAGTLALGLAAAVCTWLIGWRWPQAPAQLIGLAFGLALFAGLHVSWPALVLGGSVGPLPSSLPRPWLAWELADAATASFVWRHAADVLTAGVVLALIGALESVLSALAIDQQLDTRHDADHDLLMLGAANIVVGLFAGLPVVVLRARALATLRAGGMGQRAAVIGALSFGVMYLLFAPWLALLPKAVLAGIMLTVAVAMVDRWTRQLIGQWRGGERSAEVWETLAIVAFVCAVTVWRGFAVGVVAGVLVTLVVFVRNMNRSLVRSSYLAAAQASRRVYPSAQESFLHEARRHIVVLELEGALFFGSAERLAREVDAIGDDVRCLVLDLRGVGTIDASGAMLLEQLSAQMRQRDSTLLLAGVTAHSRHGQRLRAFGCFRGDPRPDWWPDVDRAVEAAERALLGAAGLGIDGSVCPLEASVLCRGLTAAQVEVVRSAVIDKTLAAGELLFEQGDPGDCLYVLGRGSITVIAGASGPEEGERYLSASAGMLLGETAMLDGAGRSARARADEPALVHVLTQASLDRICLVDPLLGALLYRAMALHLSQRLRSATALRHDRRRTR